MANWETAKQEMRRVVLLLIVARLRADDLGEVRARILDWEGMHGP